MELRKGAFNYLVAFLSSSKGSENPHSSAGLSRNLVNVRRVR